MVPSSSVIQARPALLAILEGAWTRSENLQKVMEGRGIGRAVSCAGTVSAVKMVELDLFKPIVYG